MTATTTYYDFFSDTLPLRGELMWMSFFFIVPLLLIPLVLSLRKRTDIITRRSTEIWALAFITLLLSFSIGVTALLVMLLWDRRFPEFPQARHDALAQKSRFLARLVYGASPEAQRETHEKAVLRAEKAKAEGGVWAKFTMNKNRLRDGDQFSAKEAQRGVVVFASFLGVMAFAQIIGNAMISYMVLDAKSAEQAVMNDRLAEIEGGSKELFSAYAETVNTDEVEVVWFEADDRSERVQPWAGLGLGTLAFNVMNPDVEFWQPAEGTWNIAQVYFEKPDGEENNRAHVTCHYIDGDLDPSMITYLFSPVLALPEAPETKTLRDLCPKTFNQEGEPLRSAVTDVFKNMKV